MDLYEDTKKTVVDLTHSKYAVPLLDRMFERPLFQSSHIKLDGVQPPSRQAVSNLLRSLRKAGLLSVTADARRASRSTSAKVVDLGRRSLVKVARLLTRCRANRWCRKETGGMGLPQLQRDSAP